MVATKVYYKGYSGPLENSRALEVFLLVFTFTSLGFYYGFWAALTARVVRREFLSAGKAIFLFIIIWVVIFGVR